MALTLRHLRGLSACLRGSVKAHPQVPGQIIYVTGSQAVIASEDEPGRQVFLRGHDDRVTAMGVSHSGALIATGQQGGNSDVVIWDVAAMQLRARFQEHDLEVVQLAFSLDDRLLLSIGSEKDRKLFVLDSASGKIVARQPLEPHKRITAAAFAPTSGTTYNFATASDNELNLYHLDPYTGMLSQQRVTAGSVRRSFTCLVYSTDGQWLYAGTTTGDVLTINVIRAAIQMAHPACGNGVGSMVLSSGGRLLVGGGDGTITLFTNDHMWRDMKPFVTVPGAITSVSPTCDGSALIVATAQGTIYRVLSGNFAVHTLSRSQQRAALGLSLAANDPECVAVASEEGSVAVWHTQNQALLQRQHETGAGAALSVALTHDLLISGWADGNIRAYARNQPGAPAAWVIPQAHCLAHSCGVTAMRASHRGAFIASGGAGGELRVWDVRSREMVANMKQHTNAIHDIVVLADDSHLVVASEDRSWSLWDVHQEKCRASWRANTMLKALAVAPDQVTVLTTGLDRRVVFWDIRSPDPIRALDNTHGAEVGAVAVANQGHVLATGGADGLVKVWDMRSGSCVSEGARHTGPVAKVAFCAGDMSILSCALDGTVATWDLQL